MLMNVTVLTQRALKVADISSIWDLSIREIVEIRGHAQFGLNAILAFCERAWKMSGECACTHFCSKSSCNFHARGNFAKGHRIGNRCQEQILTEGLGPSILAASSHIFLVGACICIRFCVHEDDYYVVIRRRRRWRRRWFWETRK